MIEVAQRAGVSVTTVSHVINGTRRVAEETRARVLEAVATLNYHPNHVARSLVQRRTATIGVVIEEIVNPLFAPVLMGVERVATQLGYGVLACSAPDLDSERRALNTLRAKRVDGVILMSLSFPRPHDHVEALRADGIPCVAINRYPKSASIDCVHFDHAGGARTATRHLLALGHQRIAHLAGPVSGASMRWAAVERLAGVRQALTAAGVSWDARYVVESEYGYEAALVAAHALLDTTPRPTAVVAWGDLAALAVVEAAEERGLRVPDDLAVVGFGDELVAARARPRLTTVSMPVAEAGAEAARLLDQQIRDGVRDPTTVVLPCRLLVRQSCGAVRLRAGEPPDTGSR